MYVFHERRLAALENAPPIVSIAIERLVEATSFGSEPEEMADCLRGVTFSRWLADCPSTPGVAQARKSLRARVREHLGTGNGQLERRLANALDTGRPTATIVEDIVRDDAQRSGDALLTSIELGDQIAVSQCAERLAAAWIGLGIHPQTIFKKVVGYVLDPDCRASETSAVERIRLLSEDFSTRTAMPHQVLASIDCGLGKRRRHPPSMSDVEVRPTNAGTGRFSLSTNVHARDPRTAAYIARLKFIEAAQAWRSGAGDLRVEVPAQLDVTMPDGATVTVETRRFRLARSRYNTASAWSNVDPDRDSSIVGAGEAVSHAREEASAGRIAQGISILWSAGESLLRREGEGHIKAEDVALRLKATYIPYWLARQFALLGVYLDSSKATQPRVKTPVEPLALLARLVNVDFVNTIKGSRPYLRHKLRQLLGIYAHPGELASAIGVASTQVDQVLYAARIIRNVYVHSRVRVAQEVEELYVYKWLETLLDVFLNSALGWRYWEHGPYEKYLAGLPGRLARFERRVAAGPPFDWALS